MPRVVLQLTSDEHVWESKKDSDQQSQQSANRGPQVAQHRHILSPAYRNIRQEILTPPTRKLTWKLRRDP